MPTICPPEDRGRCPHSLSSPKDIQDHQASLLPRELSSAILSTTERKDTANGTAALPTDQPCSFQAPFALRVPTYPQDVLNLDSQEIKKSKCENDGGAEWTGRENKMEVCIMFLYTSQKRKQYECFHIREQSGSVRLLCANICKYKHT